jgi:predicted transposase/invertase (TIGR01784 family)
MPRKTVICKSKLAPQGKFAPFTLDFTFKKAFANEQCKNLLLFLLNTFLKRVLKAPIMDVKIIQTVLPGKTRRSRGAVFDMQCEDSSGARFIVEMQVQEQEHFIKRSIFYLCMAVASLAKKGKKESRGKKIPYDYDIPVVYTLSFLNFDSDFGKGCDEVMQYISLSNDLHPEVRYDIIHLVYARLTKFNKTERQCKSDFDRLLFTLKNGHKLSKKPGSFGKAEFRQLFEIAKISNFKEEELMSYEREMKYFSDYVHTVEFAEKKGVLKTAKKMLAKGYSISEIIGVTDLPREQIKALRLG